MAKVLIMGASASMILWEENFCQRLADGGRFVIRFDNRDTGRTTCCPPGAPNYSLQDMAADAVAVLDHYGIEKANVSREMAKLSEKYPRYFATSGESKQGYSTTVLKGRRDAALSNCRRPGSTGKDHGHGTGVGQPTGHVAADSPCSDDADLYCHRFMILSSRHSSSGADRRRRSRHPRTGGGQR